MGGLFTNLGVDLPALVAQAVNFAVALIVLAIFVFRPLVRLMETRRLKIEQGLEDAKKAGEKLSEAEFRKAVLVKEAEQEAMRKIKEAEKQAQLEGENILAKTQTKADELLTEAGKIAKRKQVEELEAVEREAKTLVRSIFEKTVKLKPQAVDEALIEEAIAAIKNN